MYGLNPNSRTSIVSFNIDGMDSQEVVDEPEKQNIVLAQEKLWKKIVRNLFFNQNLKYVRLIQ